MPKSPPSGLADLDHAFPDGHRTGHPPARRCQGPHRPFGTRRRKGPLRHAPRCGRAGSPPVTAVPPTAVCRSRHPERLSAQELGPQPPEHGLAPWAGRERVALSVAARRVGVL
ncbi:hypothetical protein SCWH03_46690 [Streptomyces pacificus]|uniref:Uncharacterized protein n=1 Tax=Streptomyces pacificus TaxID=2705029 RepID=A0A6A0B3P2_9ACTN|nr:hypothetical protein SCWH03_46690 [Streptomyces pacificus]